MGQHDDGARFHLSRLDFLKYSLATSVAVWAGSTIPRGLGIDHAEAQELFSVTSTSDPSSMFPQSVASGDPRPNGVVLWTRIAPQAAAARVAFQISASTSFGRPLVSGIVDTSGARDWTVKTQVNNTALRPDQTYYYRFIYKGVASRTGRFKCLPAPNQVIRDVRLAYISCQDYTNGYYNALFHLAKENVDYVVHLGDYTYETVGSDSFQGGCPPERQFTFPDGGEEELTLRDYRFTYKKYKTDRNLQAVHEKFAFITIWDDHEFANDAHQISAPDQGGNQAGDKRNPARREVANRAWAEYTPAGVPYDAAKDPLNEIRIYRTFEFGNLLTLVMTDERLYRDGPPNGNETQNRYVTPGGGKKRPRIAPCWATAPRARTAYPGPTS